MRDSVQQWGTRPAAIFLKPTPCIRSPVLTWDLARASPPSWQYDAGDRDLQHNDIHSMIVMQVRRWREGSVSCKTLVLEIYWQSEWMHILIGQRKNNRTKKKKKDSLEKDHWWCDVAWQCADNGSGCIGHRGKNNQGTEEKRTEGLERNNQRILVGILITVLGGHRKEGRVLGKFKTFTYNKRLFIGPESNHCLSVIRRLTNWCFTGWCPLKSCWCCCWFSKLCQRECWQ